MLRRRKILGIGALLSAGSVIGGSLYYRWATKSRRLRLNPVDDTQRHLGVESDGRSRVAMVRHGSPEENLIKALELLGGIERFVRPGDIVLLKPNSQWWAQGTTNTNAMAAFIQAVLEVPGFAESDGELIVADNHHFPDRDSRGWNTTDRNGDYNLNELVEHFQRRGHRNVTKVHWHDGGPSTPKTWGGAADAGVVEGPADGDGYVWTPDLVWTAKSGRRAMMSYPIFTSPFSGLRIDYRNGPWKEGAYLRDRRLRMVNFAGLNHHSWGPGVTASIKNYMGVCDMTCGYRGTTPPGYWNFHFAPYSQLHWRIKKLIGRFGWKEQFPALGSCLAYFMKTIRFADLNIVTADWVGVGSRTKHELSARPRALLASRDPVALDYTAGAEVLMPETIRHPRGADYLLTNDPRHDRSPFRRFLLACHMSGIGNIDPARIEILGHSFKKG